MTMIMVNIVITIRAIIVLIVGCKVTVTTKLYWQLL